jgi:hypothetical protein
VDGAGEDVENQNKGEHDFEPHLGRDAGGSSQYLRKGFFFVTVNNLFLLEHLRPHQIYNTKDSANKGRIQGPGLCIADAGATTFFLSQPNTCHLLSCLSFLVEKGAGTQGTCAEENQEGP